MMYLVVIALVIRGELIRDELIKLKDSLDGFEIVDIHPPDSEGRHPLLIYTKVSFGSDDFAIQYAQDVARWWRVGLSFDPYLRSGYVKSVHLLVHSLDQDLVLWNESSPIDYLFDDVSSTNNTYQGYGILP